MCLNPSCLAVNWKIRLTLFMLFGADIHKMEAVSIFIVRVGLQRNHLITKEIQEDLLPGRAQFTQRSGSLAPKPGPV